MREKLYGSLLALMVSCQGQYYIDDTNGGVGPEDVHYSIEEINIGDYEVSVSAPDSIYGMYLITKNGGVEADDVHCSGSWDMFACRWSLENNPPLGVRLYERGCDSLEIMF